MTAYFDSFELKAKQGYFEEFQDVKSFYYRGEDNIGFKFYYRFHRSTQIKIFIKKGSCYWFMDYMCGDGPFIDNAYSILIQHISG